MEKERHVEFQLFQGDTSSKSQRQGLKQVHLTLKFMGSVSLLPYCILESMF